MKFARKLIHGGGQCTNAMNQWRPYSRAWFYLNICWTAVRETCVLENESGLRALESLPVIAFMTLKPISVRALKQKIKKKQTLTKFKGRALHWPNSIGVNSHVSGRFLQA